MKKTAKKLRLNVQTVKALIDRSLQAAQGGRATNTSDRLSCSCAEAVCNETTDCG